VNAVVLDCRAEHGVERASDPRRVTGVATAGVEFGAADEGPVEAPGDEWPL
jgi:hypothetical protein